MKVKNTNSIGADKIPRGTTITKEIDDALRKNASASKMTLTSYLRELMTMAADSGLVFEPNRRPKLKSDES